MNNRALSLSLALMAGGCSGGIVHMGDAPPVCAIPEGCPDGGGGDSGGSSDGSALSNGTVTIRLFASTDKVQHLDGLSGQTPLDQKIGIRKLTLLTSDDDPNPYVVFDHKALAVEAGLNDKNETTLASFPASSLRAGTYTRARVAISYVRYRVAANMHTLGMNVPGMFNNFQVLSDGSTVDGQPWNKGHYLFQFDVNGQTYGSQSGENGPVPQVASGGGFTLDTSGAESEYRMVVNLGIPEKVTHNVTITFSLNTHENFRWQEQTDTGYQKGVFDVTPTSYEPVVNFGANSFQITAAF